MVTAAASATTREYTGTRKALVESGAFAVFTALKRLTVPSKVGA